MKRKLLMMLIPIMGFCFHSSAQGDLLVTPRRVVFEGNKQKEELNLVNLGKDTATFSISFVQRRMKEDGSNESIDKPDSGQMFADPYLRIFPRTVTLAPDEPQVIMLQCRRKPDMLPGEYRSHLYFRSEKEYNAIGMGNSANDSMRMNVQLTPIFGISIPVIIRSGPVNVSATLTGLQMETKEDTMTFLKFTINRTGNISLFGNLKVEYVPSQGKPHIIGELNSVGVYTNINKRNIVIKLNKTSGMFFNTGKLKVSYTSPKEEKYVVYAEAELELK
jgi:hypothetical protein